MKHVVQSTFPHLPDLDMSYKADVGQIRETGLPEDKLPLKFVPAQPASYEFDKKKYEELRESDPAAYKLLAAHVVTKPKKPSVTLKV